ncbi:MAG: DMT family transporter, partial [Pseudomonadota bacterium]
MTDTVTADQGVGRAWIGPVAVLCGGICIGFAPIGLRLGLDTLGPQAIAMWRYIFALPILLTALVLIQRRGPAKPVPAVILAGVCFALDIALWHWALERTTVANATFIVNLGNICVGFLAWIVLRERPTLLWGIAVLIAMTGAGLLSQGGPADGKADLYGDLLAVG